MVDAGAGERGPVSQSKKSARFRLAMGAGKAANAVLTALKRKGGQLPGVIAEKIDPDFLAHIGKPGRIVFVTGTNGKTTTTNLLDDLLADNGFDLVTNRAGSNTINGIESSLIKNADLSGNQRLQVACMELDELSSRLVLPHVTPDLLLVCNLYRDSFMRNANPDYIFDVISKNVSPETELILNADDPVLAEYVEKYPVPATVKSFSLDNTDTDNYVKDGQLCVGDEPVLPLTSIRLPGKHNLQNVMIAVSVAKVLGIANETIKEVVEGFTGVEHRIEFVRELDGVRYYNDSKGTNTDATVTALKAFDKGVILLLGGFEKGLPMDDVKAHLGCVKKVIGFGACGPRLVADTVGEDGIVVTTLDEAVAEAVKIAEPGDTVLLSPTTSSFDQYTCFEERGDHFKKLVNAL